MSSPPTHSAFVRCALVGICVLAAALRVPGLASVPPPLQQDEASRGYDAWCLLETGADRWGARWPLFLRSFGPGDFTAALSTYITIPFVAALGPTPTAFRLPTALLGVLTVPALWLWLRRLLDDKHTALLAALLLAVNPWHIVLTRTAHEAAYVPFFLAWGLAGLASRRVWAMAGGGVMLGLAAWDYPAARMIVPLLMVLWYAINRKSEIGNRKWTAAVGFVFGGLPVWLTLLHAPERVAARASSTSLFTLPLGIGEMVWRCAVHYAAEFEPVALFFAGDDVSHSGTPGIGRLLHLEMPFVLVGLLVLLKNAATPGNRGRFGSGLILLLLLLHPLPAAICRFWSPHALRAVCGVIVWPAVSAIGAMALWRSFVAVIQSRERERPVPGAREHNEPVACARGSGMRWICIAAAIALLANTGWMAYSLDVRWPTAAADSYQENLCGAVEFVGPRVCCVDFVHVTEYANQPYIYALLFSPVPPGDFSAARDRMFVAPWHERFEHVVRLGKWHFRPIVQGPRDGIGLAAMARFETEWSKLLPGSRGLAIDLPGRGPPGKVLLTLPRRDGTPGLEVRECVLAMPPARP